MRFIVTTAGAELGCLAASDEGTPHRMEWRNFRDVADLRAVQSYAVRRGMLYRSAAFSHLPERLAKDWFRAKGIRRILDLRMTEEFVDTECDPAEICERLHVPLFETVSLEWSHPIDRSPEATATRYVEMADTGGPALVKIVEILAADGGIPTLLHCVAGRDRTGIVVACILDILGVGDEAIGEDYALSHVMDDEEGRNANPRNIQLFLEGVRKKYGSTEKLLRRFGGSDEISSRLRRALIEGHRP